MNFYRNVGKRVFDLVFASLALIILSPILAVVALLVRIKLGPPVIFRQKRPGRHGQIFTLFKFRSMCNAKDTKGHLLPDSQRLTLFGRFIRASSIDEMPELFNVIRGEMALVGPRPLLVEYMGRYTAEQSRRHEIRPGITGWAQVNGRQDIPFSKRFLLDVDYVKGYSFAFDTRILMLTILRIFGDGVRSGQDVLEVDDIGMSGLKANFDRKEMDR